MSALSLNQLTSSSVEASPSTTMKRNRPKTARIKTTKFRKTGFEEDEENDGAPPSKKPAPIFPLLLQYDCLTATSSNNNVTNCSSNSVEQSVYGETCSSNNIPQLSVFVETPSNNSAYDQSTLAENGSSNEQSTFDEPCSSNNTDEQSPLNEVVAAVPVIVTPITNPSDFLTTKKISKVYFADEIGKKLAEITICERYIINKPGEKACFEHGKEGIHLAKAFQRFDGSEDNNLYSLISEYKEEEEGELVSPTISTEYTPTNDSALNTPEEAFLFTPNTAVATLATQTTSTSNNLIHFHDRLYEKKESYHSKYSHSSPSRNRLYGSSHFSKAYERKSYDDSSHYLPFRDYRRPPATNYHHSPARGYHRSASSDKYHERSHYRSSLLYEKNRNFHQSRHSPARTFRRSPSRDYRRSSSSNYHRSPTSDKYHGRSQYRSPILYEKNDDYSYHRRRNSPVKNFSRSLPRNHCY